MAEILEKQQSERILHLTLNRPEKRNALNVDLCRALVHAVRNAERDPSVSVILLDANGPAFCSGMDLTETLERNEQEIHEIHEQLFTLYAHISKPVVSAINGPALAGGTGLVANTQIAVAADTATFGLTEIRIGLWPFLVFRAVRLAIGERRATELSLTGRIISADEAQHFGLIHHIVPGADLALEARKIAEAIAEFSPTALRSGLAFTHESRGKGMHDAAQIGRRVRSQIFESADFKEGVKAFREKRKPKWPSLG